MANWAQLVWPLPMKDLHCVYGVSVNELCYPQQGSARRLLLSGIYLAFAHTVWQIRADAVFLLGVLLNSCPLMGISRG